ncbi:SCAN domain-containing protein 3 [Trichinella pseudospiralis]|uniref:SCAN domain-containing protein 3 n=1 Tax=Trichinella pseudospiralis TaxID=6337 RepID=A0A0V0YCM2_TRIPS|nr:SCAN domain-containing protein 3 [Trichinella pseudospiralis]
MAIKGLVLGLGEVLKTVITIVNFIKTDAINTRLFTFLCFETDLLHKNPVYYLETRWLLRGNVLNCLLELRNEIEVFLAEEKHALVERFSNK